MGDINEVSYLLNIVDKELALFNKYKAQINKDYAIEFSPLNQIIWVNENMLSRILCYFLNPKEKHFQGKIYLQAFIDLLQQEKNYTALDRNFTTAECETEKIFKNGRRIDIYIKLEYEGNLKHTIAIENKLWAADQADQLTDYYKHIEKDKKLLIYWTIDEKEPDGYTLEKSIYATEKDKSILLLSHNKFTIELLDKWIGLTKPPNIRTFLEDVLNHLNLTLNNKNILQMENKIAETILDNNKLEAAFEISKALGEVKIKVFKDAIANANKTDYPFEVKEGYKEKNTTYIQIFVTKTIEATTYKLIFGWQLENFNNGFWGISESDLPESSNIEFYKFMHVNIKKLDKLAEASKLWPFFNYLDDSYRNFNNETWMQLQRNSTHFIEYINNKATSIFNLINEYEQSTL